MGPDIIRWVDANTLVTKVDRVFQQFSGKDLVPDDFLIVIKIIDEQVEGLHPLFQAAFNLVPLCLVNDTGDNIERPGTINGAAFLFRVHGKSNAHDMDRKVGSCLVFIDLFVFKFAKIVA